MNPQRMVDKLQSVFSKLDNAAKINISMTFVTSQNKDGWLEVLLCSWKFSDFQDSS